VHVTKDGIADTFRAAHVDRDPARSLEEPSDLTAEARAELRNHYFAAEVGITGANFLIAETGSTVIVTNEGNGDLTQTFAKTHIVVTSIEKVVPTLDDAMTLARVLARSSTGQEFSVYTTVSTGPRRPGDVDGPEAFHVVLVDNGRSAMLGGDFQDMLRCIRCAACMNHCPVYAAVGGHAYGWVYPGPMGAVLTPSLHGHAEARHLPNASTFCGRCEQVCPVRIPLPGLMRKYREREHEQRLAPPIGRILIGLWAALARRPALYRLATGIAGKALSAWAGRRGRLSSVPLAGGWTGARDLPAPAARSFMERYRAGERR
jgi:L-lactate dehydrogenase complex protein LldF